MSFYNPFKKEEREEQDSNWIFKSSVKAGIVGGLAFGGYSFMKGPHGKLVNDYIKNKFMKVFESEIDKDSHEKPLPEFITNLTGDREELIDFNLDDSNVSPAIKGNIVDTVTGKDGSTHGILRHQGLIRNINRLESAFLNISTTDINSQMKRKGISASFGGVNSDEIFAELRLTSMLDYVSNHPMSTDFEFKDKLFTLEKLRDPVGIARLHQQFLEYEPYYANMFLKKMKQASNQYRKAKATYLANPSTNYTPELVRKFLYGGEFTSTVDSSLEITAYMGKLKHGFQYRNSENLSKNINLMQELDKGLKITSGSLSNKGWKDHPLFDKLGQVDYTGSLNKLKTKLKSLISDSTNTGIEDASLELVQLGARSDKSWHIKIGLKHIDKTKQGSGAGGMHYVNIPLNQWGIIPSNIGSSSSKKLDGLMIEGSNFGQLTIKENMITNTTKILIHDFIKKLDGSLITNQFRSDPYHAIKQFRRTVTTHLELPIAQGQLRDVVKLMRITNPDLVDIMSNTTISQKGMRDMLNEAISSMENLRRLHKIASGVDPGVHASRGAIHTQLGYGVSPGGVVSVSIDLETMSRELPGPSHIASDPYTQITQVGISVDEYNKKGMKNIHAEKIVSDHGYHYFNDGGKRGGYGFTEENTDFLKSLLKMDDKASPQEVADTYFKTFLNPEAKLSQKGLRGGSTHSEFKNNQELVEHVAKRIESIIENAKASGKEVFITTKNGRAFDLHLLKKYAPHVFSRLDKSVIDLQSIAYYQQKGFGGVGSLKLNKLILEMMGRMGLNPIDIDVAGGRHSNAEHALLSIAKKGNSIDIDLASMKRLKRAGMGKAHMEPTVDALFANVLIQGQRHLIDSIEDSSYTGIQSLKEFLTSGRQSMEDTFIAMNAIEGSEIPGWGSTSFSASSHGMIANQLASLVHSNMLRPFADNKMTKQWDQLHAGATFGPSSTFLKKIGVGHGENLLRNRIYRNRFFDPVRTKTSIVAEEMYKHLTASSQANYYQHQVMGKVLFTWNAFLGREGYTGISKNLLDEISYHETQYVRLDSKSFSNSPTLANRVRNMRDDILKTAKDISKKRGIPISGDIYEEAANLVSAQYNIEIPKGTKVTLAKGDMGIQTIKTEIAGKIQDVILEEDALGNINQIAKIVYASSGQELKNTTMKVRTPGGKAIAGILPDAFAYGVDIDGVQNADFFDSKYIGVYKEVMFRKALDRLIDKSSSSNPDRVGRKKAIDALKHMGGKINAKFINGRFEMIDPGYKKKDFGYLGRKNLTHHERQIIGNVDVSLEDINRWLVDAGEVWDEKMIKAYYGMFSDKNIVGSTWHDMKNSAMASIKGNIDRYLKSKENDLKSIYGPDNWKIQYEKQANLLNTFLLPDVGSARMVGEQDANGNFIFGVSARVPVSFLDINAGQQLRPIDIQIRKSNLMAIQTSSHLHPKTVAHLKSSAAYYKNAELFRAKKSMDKFRDVLISKALSDIPNLTVTEIERLIDPSNRLKLLKERKRLMSDSDLDATKSRLMEIVDYNDYSNKEEMEKEIDNLIESIKSSKENKKIKDNANIMHRNDTIEWVSFARKNGIFSISADKESGKVFQFKNIYDMIGIKYSSPNVVKDLTSKADTLLEKMKDFFDKSAGEGIIESLHVQSGSQTSVINRLNFGDYKSGKIKVDKVVGFNLKNLVMKADTSPGLISNEVSHELRYRTKENKLIYDVLVKSKDYLKQTTSNLTMNITDNGSQLKEATEALTQSYLIQLLRGNTFDKSSKFWQSENAITPAGLIGKLHGAESIYTAAHKVISGGGLKNLKSFKGDVSKINQYDDILKNILNDKFNTMYLSEDAFNMLEVYDEKQGISKKVSLSRELDKQLAKDTTSTGKQLRDYIDRVRSGQDKFSGFMVRYPLQQSGNDAILDKTMRVIPKELQDVLGINDNGLYAYAVHSLLIGGDHDGDSAAIGVHNLDTIKKFTEYRNIPGESLNELLKRQDIKNVINKQDSKWLLDIDTDSHNFVFASLNQDGSFSSRKVHRSNMDFYSFFKDGMETVANSTLHTATGMTPEYGRSQVNNLLNIAISQNNIGITTNITTKRMRQVLQSGLVKDPILKNQIIGNLSYGFSGISQEMISFGKHGQDTAKKAKAFDYLMFLNPDSNPEGRQYLKEMWVNKYITGLADDTEESITKYRKLGEDTWNIAEQSMIQRDKFEKFDEVAKVRYKAIDDVILGRETSTVFSNFLSSEDNDLINIARWTMERATGSTDGNIIAPPIDINNGWGDLASSIKSRLNIDTNVVDSFKKGGKYAAVGAGVFMALNFFRPNQLSNSSNPLDMFVDLGHNIDGQNNIFNSSLQLERRVPLDIVDPSFSKEALVKLGNNSSNQRKVEVNIINSMLQNSSFNPPSFKNVTSKKQSNYTNYTTSTSNVSFFGSSNMERKYNGSN